MDKTNTSTASLAEKSQSEKKKGYIEATGRRKTSVARVRITEASVESITVNGSDVAKYFPTEDMQAIVRDALVKVKTPKFKVTVLVSGGGIHSQAEAVRHGISRAIISFSEDFRKKLKRAGYLKRDPRMKERRKFGLKKARKSPQWSKR
ncbi:MAG: 30S ribosomal protein S9 [Candidatus Lloydbacteria bacterium CG22_combo_CG10-13_8_21_14_all_47_15]|uniref:Small ribosomal subunit protein uS9 n=1 Tax=Candidatus Lloydbacteria bacterium CG22_combo_CG10-13_8_21_14_all_47_15 TaxID=1974635 RepID=A0A2H0CTL3_9BACT|nr:MAG: 30S ribosomal protein S9 [Candidatus Lloydbacteria bacterium CG22_combo_CG10-13_8_21_14_all_47_15]